MYSPARLKAITEQKVREDYLNQTRKADETFHSILAQLPDKVEQAASHGCYQAVVFNFSAVTRWWRGCTARDSFVQKNVVIPLVEYLRREGFQTTIVYEKCGYDNEGKELGVGKILANWKNIKI